MKRSFGFRTFLLITVVVLLCVAQRLEAITDAGSVSIGDNAVNHQCSLSLVNNSWHGSCGQIFDDKPVFTITKAQGLKSGVWRKDISPTEVWSGNMVTGDSKDFVEIEIYSKGTGIFRGPDGWFPVSNFAVLPNELKFQIDTSHEVPPSDLDRQIVQRAAVILSTDAAWSRKETRVCSEKDTQWGIYCAMEKATREVTGGLHHRRPALQIVREIVDVRTKDRNYHHRLMDYNNDPSTKLADVQSLFAEALAKMNRP